MVSVQNIKFLYGFHLIIQLVRFSYCDDVRESINNNQTYDVVKDCSNGLDDENCESYRNLLLYSTVSEIKLMDLTTNQTSTLVHEVNCTALTAARDHVYYATLENMIFRASIHSNTTQKEELIKSDLAITSISVDYITGNIYYTSNGSIFVCNEKSQNCKPTNCCNITFVALAPMFGCMFYVQIEDGQSSIVQASMDGSDVILFHDPKDHIAIPIAVDEQAKKILLADRELDQKYTLQFQKFNSSYNKATVPSIQVCYYQDYNIPYSLATIGGMSIFNNGNNSKVNVRRNLDFRYTIPCDFPKLAGNYFEDNSTAAIKLLYAYNPSRTNSVKRAQNPCAGASCPGLCLLRPTVENATLTYACQGDQIYRWYSLNSVRKNELPKQEPLHWSTFNNESYGNMLLYSTLSEIKSMNLTTKQTHTLVPEINCTAITAARDHVYYATLENIIYRVSIHPNSTHKEKLIESGSMVTSIAVDYITGNIYYTADGSLFVCGEKGQHCKVTNCCHITFVALAPMSGFMFYIQTEYGLNNIVKANMDGSEVMKFYSYTDESIAVDELAKQIIFMEIDHNTRYRYLVYREFNGSFNETTFFNNKRICQYIENRYENSYSLATIEDMSLFSNGINSKITLRRNSQRENSTFYFEYEHYCESFLEQHELEDNTTAVIKLLYIYNPLWQNSVKRNQNPCSEASCSGLCLLRPSPENSAPTYTCQGDQIYRWNATPVEWKDDTMIQGPIYWSTADESSGNILLYSTESEINSKDLTTNQTRTLVHQVNCTALTAARDHVYYATSENIIFRASIHPNATQKEILIESGLTVTSIAVDYITGNIYYTANGSLFVCGEKGQNCKMTNCCNITFVALAPMFGSMFYVQTEYGFSSVMQANMDGSDAILFYRYIGIPIAVDEQAKRIVLVNLDYNNQKYTVEHQTFNTNFNTITFHNITICEYEHYNLPYYLAASEGVTIFSDGWNSKMAMRKNSDSRYSNYPCDQDFWPPTYKDNSTAVIKLLYAYNPLWQTSVKQNLSNPCSEASCQGLCLLRPSVENATLSYACQRDHIYKYHEALPEWLGEFINQEPSYLSTFNNESYGGMLLYSTISEIKSVDFSTNQTRTLVHRVNCTALTAARDHVYYATLENFIFRTSIHPNTTKREKLIKSDVAVTSIAVDYITGNIYYAAGGSLFVCGEKGQNCKVTNCCNITLIALAPMFGFMFYAQTDYNLHNIVKANMDGSEVDFFDGYTDIPLAVDEQAKNILFTHFSHYEDKYTLTYRKFTDGDDDDKTMLYNNKICSLKEHFEDAKLSYSVATIGDISLLTYGKNSKIIMRRKSDSRFITACDFSLQPGSYFEDNTTAAIKLLYAYNPLWENSVKRNQSNPCAEASCPRLCLLRPSVENATLTYACQGDEVYRWHSYMPDYMHDGLMYQEDPVFYEANG